MPVAEENTSVPSQEYGEGAAREAFIDQTGGEFKPLSYQPPPPVQYQPPEDLVAGSAMAPDEAAAILRPGVGAMDLTGLEDWLPVVEEMSRLPDTHPILQDIINAARAQLEEGI